MNDWEKVNETSLPEKQDIYSHLNMKDITNADYKDAKRVFKVFEIINMGKYYDLFVQINTLLQAGVFNNFWNMYLEIYGLDPPHFLSAPGLAWQKSSKNSSIKKDLSKTRSVN